MGVPIEELLSQWRSYVKNISSNLIELSEDLEFQLITSKAKDTTNGYTGRTKVKADSCVESMANLWRFNGLLSEVIEKADKLNSKRSLLFNPENAVRELLEKTPIIIETEHVAINQRNLLSGEHNEKKVTAPELLKFMKDSFELLCREVTEITKATEEVDSRLKDIKVDIANLRNTAIKLGVTSFPSFDIKKFESIESDPVQGVMELDKLVYSIEKYRASIQAIEGEYNSIENSFNSVRDMLAELKDLSEKTKIALQESKKIFGFTESIEASVKEEVLISLQGWLKVLENKITEGPVKAVKVGLSKLEAECTTKLENERKIYLNISENYNEWLDLKGQFKALLAKAGVFTAKGIMLDSSLNRIIEDTRNALYTNPVNLDKCRSLVRNFDLSLKG